MEGKEVGQQRTVCLEKAEAEERQKQRQREPFSGVWITATAFPMLPVWRVCVLFVQL